MNQKIEGELIVERVKKQRIIFSDGNRALHLETFLEWLPNDLHTAPLIDWTQFPSRNMALLINMDQNSIFIRPLALIAGSISGISGAQNELTLYHGINRVKLLLYKLQTGFDIQNIDELTKEVWQNFVNNRDFTPQDYYSLLDYKNFTVNHLAGYLEQLDPEQHAKVAPYILPRLPYRFLERNVDGPAIVEEARLHRKAQTDMIAPLHPILIALIRFRKQSAQRLLSAYWKARERAEAENLSLPLPFSYEDEFVTVNRDAQTVSEIRLEKRRVTLRFLLWERRSWVQNHPELYQRETRKRAERGSLQFENKRYFLQFIDNTEDLFWFGDLIKFRLLQRETVNKISPEYEQRRNEILKKLGLSVGLDCSRGGVLAPTIDLALTVAPAKIQEYRGRAQTFSDK